LEGAVNKFHMMSWQLYSWKIGRPGNSIPLSLNSIGVRETIGLAEERFREVALDYLTLWATETKRDSDEFARWLLQLRRLIGGEIGDVWRKDEWHSAWFGRVCENKIDEALADLQQDWESRARELEIQSLRNPQRSIESLLAEARVMSNRVKRTVSKKATKTIEQLLGSLQHARSLTRTIGEAPEALGETPSALIENRRATAEPVPSMPMGKTATTDDPATEPQSMMGTADPKRSGEMPRRTPDLKKSRERLAFLESIATELATIKQDLGRYCTVKLLKNKYPRFVIFKLLSQQELQEIVDGVPFSPRAFAENLTLRKFGITSRAALKKDRCKIKRAEQRS
jgi:hypothetical protein